MGLLSIQGIQTENLQLAVFRSSNILANYNFPLNAALQTHTCPETCRGVTHLSPSNECKSEHIKMLASTYLMILS